MDDFVLVVDDDEGIRDSIHNLLEDEGYRVVSAANGQRAFEVIQTRGRPRLILLDLMMPVMDGGEFRSRQLADPAIADIPVVLITAAGARMAQAVPVQTVLAKPLKAEVMLEIVASYFRA